MTDGEVADCAAAIRAADCAELNDVAEIRGCEPMQGPIDAGQDAD